ncbi:hypothetical protein SRHO_G00143360 [Serrasalmus rhombeus]
MNRLVYLDCRNLLFSQFPKLRFTPPTAAGIGVSTARPRPERNRRPSSLHARGETSAARRAARAARAPLRPKCLWNCLSDLSSAAERFRCSARFCCTCRHVNFSPRGSRRTKACPAR